MTRYAGLLLRKALRKGELAPEVRKQIAVSDVVLLSKTDIASPEARTEVEAAVKSINAGAEIIAVQHGEIDPAILFGRSVQRSAADLERWLGAVDRGGRSYTVRHADDIRTFTLYHDEPVARSGIATRSSRWRSARRSTFSAAWWMARASQ